MKTREELNALKEEFANLNKKLQALSEDELRQVTGRATQKPLPGGGDEYDVNIVNLPNQNND